MPKLKVTEDVPRKICTPKMTEKINALGFNTDGSIASLKEILTSRGFKLPILEGKSYFFTVQWHYYRSYLNYADALAGEILLLNQLFLI